MNVSVIIPVYNAEQFVSDAVISVLAHKEVKEVVLVEDGSTDETLKACKELQTNFEKVKLFRHKDGINRGAGASRNLGIKNATQEYISFLDADDAYTSIRFNMESEIFIKNIDCDGVYGAIGVHYFDKEGAKAWEKKGYNIDTLTGVNKIIKPSHLFEFLIGYKNKHNYRGYFSIIGLTVKRSKLIESKVLFDETLRLHQDSVFIFQLAYYLNLYTGEINSPIAVRGVHAGNRYIHAQNIKSSQSKARLILRDWAIAKGLNKMIISFFNETYLKLRLQSIRKRYRLLCFVRILVLEAKSRSYLSATVLSRVLRLMF